MSLLSNLVVQFAPSVRNPSSSTYRSIVRETGAYSDALDGYEPYAADHEPPDETTRPERARIVFERTVAAEADRNPKTVSYLERHGLKPSTYPAGWDAIGDWLAVRVEGSREPGSDRYRPFVGRNPASPPPTSVNGESTSVLRPRLRALAFDLGLLLGRRMIEASPGASWASESEIIREGSCLGEPRVLLANGRNTYTPFARVVGHMKVALVLKLGLAQPDRPRLGGAVRDVLDPIAIDPFDPEGDFLKDLRMRREEGLPPPTRDDVLELLVDHRLREMPKMPDELAAWIGPEALKV